ncbi:MAG: AAA family ATPase [Burkholderiales bacterium]|nr:AAA family ATPase [Burkholderiales bacterium]
MARIRKVEIRNFRAVRSLDWCPAAGVNCLIGPGDSGKSTILDAPGTVLRRPAERRSMCTLMLIFGER